MNLYYSLSLSIDFNAERQFVIDDYEFVSPNWRISFSVTITEFLNKQCKIIGVTQKKNAHNVRHDDNRGRRLPGIFFTPDSNLGSSAYINGGNHKAIYYNLQLNKVSNY